MVIYPVTLSNNVPTVVNQVLPAGYEELRAERNYKRWIMLPVWKESEVETVKERYEGGMDIRRCGGTVS